MLLIGPRQAGEDGVVPLIPAHFAQPAHVHRLVQRIPSLGHAEPLAQGTRELAPRRRARGHHMMHRTSPKLRAHEPLVVEVAFSLLLLVPKGERRQPFHFLETMAPAASHGCGGLVLLDHAHLHEGQVLAEHEAPYRLIVPIIIQVPPQRLQNVLNLAQSTVLAAPAELAAQHGREVAKLDAPARLVVHLAPQLDPKP